MSQIKLVTAAKELVNLPNETDIIAAWDTSKPLISVHCTVYNHEKFLDRCLQGMLIQKCKYPFEILIHDDASKDKSTDIIDAYQIKYPNIIRSIIQTENQYSKGFKPRDFLYQITQGTYIALCEGDDYWTDEYKLELQADFLEANPQYVATSHNATTIDIDNNILATNRLPMKHRKDYRSGELRLGKGYILLQNIFFRNVDSDELPEARRIINGDVFLCARLGLYGDSHYDTRIKNSVHIRHEGGIWSGRSEIERVEAHVESFFYIYKYFKRKGIEDSANAYLRKFIRHAMKLAKLRILASEFLVRIFNVSIVKRIIFRSKN